MPAHVVVSSMQRIAGVVEALLDGIPGRTLAARAARISKAYRASIASDAIIDDETDAAVYAVMRMPATAAAVAAVLDALAERAPDFMPQTVLDAGAGPGTASLVVADIWPQARLTLCDAHKGFLALAERLLAQDAPDTGAAAQFIAADLTRSDAALPVADLVIASYALTELGDADHFSVARRLWTATKSVLVVVEPGRPRDYERLMAFRSWAVGRGARVAAPCPHEAPCPLADKDWCHFSVRLPRSRSHLRLKSAALGYEDEKFSYLVLARPEIGLEPALSRVLAPPEAVKHETRLKLCAPDGQVAPQAFARRNPHFSRIRRAKWGDSLDLGEGKGEQ